MLKQSSRAEPSQAKASLIYKYTKKGVLLEDKVGPCSTSSTFFKFIRQPTMQWYGDAYYLRLYRPALMMRIFILRRGQTDPNQTNSNFKGRDIYQLFQYSKNLVSIIVINHLVLPIIFIKMSTGRRDKNYYLFHCLCAENDFH